MTSAKEPRGKRKKPASEPKGAKSTLGSKARIRELV